MLRLRHRILRIAAVLNEAAIPYAFGGAIAFGFHAQPRSTRDIDINIFVSELDSAPVLTALTAAGIAVDMQRDATLIRRDGQVRLRWDVIMVDLFFMNFDFLESCRDRVWRVPFEGCEIPILSAEDLAVCKIAFNREKDWLDLKEVVTIQGERLDVAYIRRWLTIILGEDDPRTLRFEALVEG
jgi:hypothetical protein